MLRELQPALCNRIGYNNLTFLLQLFFVASFVVSVAFSVASFALSVAFAVASFAVSVAFAVASFVVSVAFVAVSVAFVAAYPLNNLGGSLK
jgi:hypothetical protein